MLAPKMRIGRLIILLSVSAVVTLLCLEATTYFLNSETEYTFEPSLVQEDKLLGYKHKPKVRVHAAKKARRKTVFDVTYSTDGYGRRITPEQHNKHTDRFILFFGCLFTFGEGVQDNETLPFYVGQAAPTYRVYNYGVGGYGPQHLLAQLQSSQFSDGIREKDGILVYTFIDHHMLRAIGWMQILGWGRNFPYYTIDGEDSLVRKGSFVSGRPLLSHLYLLLWKSRMVQLLDRVLHLPRIGDRDIKLTARMIEESREAFKEKFPSGKFYVVIYPIHGAQYGGRLVAYLKKADINYLDYSTLTDPMTLDTIPDDSHPSARSYRAIALKLANDIGVTQNVARAPAGNH